MFTVELGFIWTGAMAFTRGMALIALIPGIGGQAAPKRNRIALGLFLAIFTATTLGPVGATDSFPDSVGELLLSILNELMIGLMMGFAARMVFFALELAGHVMSHEMGLMMSTSLDPLSGKNQSTLGTLLFYFALLIFFVSGIYREVLAAYLRSFELVPPGSSLLATGNLTALVKATARIFEVATLMSAPLLAINFLVLMAFSVLGKAVPKMNVFLVSFSVRILAGFMVLIATTTLIAHYIFREHERAPEMMLRFIFGG